MKRKVFGWEEERKRMMEGRRTGQMDAQMGERGISGWAAVCDVSREQTGLVFG